MKPAVAEWVSKAEGDFLTAGRELRARKSPNYDAVCFHSQQCAEKYLKAVLQENDRHIPKIHTPTPTPYLGPWPKLKDSSYASRFRIQSTIPNSPIAYDSDDTTQLYFIIGDNGVVEVSHPRRG